MNSSEPPAQQTTANSGHSAPAPTLLVLAAGMGSRFGGLKQIAPVNAAGEAILDYSLYDAARAGFERAVFVIRRDIEQAFKAAIGSRFEHRLDVAYAYQELDSLLDAPPPPGRTKPWGTLQATLVGAELIPGPFAVINSDDFYGAESYSILLKHLQADTGRSATVGFRLRNTLSDFGPVSREVCRVDADGLLLRVDERKSIVRRDGTATDTAADGAVTEINLDAVVSMNMWALQPATVPLLRSAFERFLQQQRTDLKSEAYLPEAINGIVSAGAAKVAVLPTEAVWCGMTYREDTPGVVERIRQLTADGQYPETLWP